MTTSPAHDHTQPLDEAISEEGYHKDLGRRHIQMIAIGGAIGTGLFLGAGTRLEHAGPSLALIYAICGAFSFLILRALGELIMYRPTSGSFVTYAREFMGEKAAYAAGWLSFLNWAMTGIADITAVALYMHYWGVFIDVPQWVFALCAMTIVGTMNMIGVRYFGEMEFWFSLIKIVALILFLIAGTLILGTRMPVAGHTTGLSLITSNGGLFPHGIVPALLLMQGVVFAYSGIELIGTAAGECHDARKVLPSAVNSVIWRIALFYVGSVVLLVCLLPWTSYHAGTSPFVTFFQALGIPGAGTIMNIVVLTAALSSLNSGLYSTGRVLRALSLGGSGPKALSKMSKSSVPYVGILTTLTIYLLGVGLNYIIPTAAFEVVLDFSAVGIMSTWIFILLCQQRLRKKINQGEIPATAFPMPFAPYTNWASLGFLVFVLTLMAFDYPKGTITIGSIPLIFGLLAIGWFLLKNGRKNNA